MSIKGWIFTGFGVLALVGIILGYRDGKTRGEKAILDAIDEENAKFGKPSIKDDDHMDNFEEQWKVKKKEIEEIEKELDAHQKIIMDDLDLIAKGIIPAKEQRPIWKEIDEHRAAQMKIIKSTLKKLDEWKDVNYELSLDDELDLDIPEIPDLD